ncbi:hypothetical protein EUX98_g9526 [Antrodiella citrinella]|uniref:Uncharacterized protein n=1 Tax=Antrodiella citrinella TaxID=2447956 RepID=A0A4S4LRP5_9APHY|nr:hypothetical protein EUX98_g9526 [Antrodiella citrinella]
MVSNTGGGAEVPLPWSPAQQSAAFVTVFTDYDREEEMPNAEAGPSGQNSEHAASVAAESDRDHQIDDIKVEFHPNSQRPTKHYCFEDYGHHTPLEPQLEADERPWRPFRSRGDFEFAEITLQAGLNNPQTDALIKLINRIIEGESKFTLRSHSELKRTWEDAADLHTPWYQTQLPPNASPFGFILFSDKTRLSSFGTEKGYPIIARIANLPVDIRNGSGLGGGKVVGWLPVIAEDPAETGKKGFINMKHAVWHECFRELMKVVAALSYSGYAFKTFEDIVRYLFPFIAILSADYEEQCVMALIRGTMCLFPCPICMSPQKKLADLRAQYPLRTAEASALVIRRCNGMRREDAEALLKEHGLREVPNVFWELNNSDPHRTLSFDRLHAHDDGLFGHHLFQRWQAHLEALGRGAQTKVDHQLELMPTWRGLNHFTSASTTLFTDGSKYEDLAKTIIFASHNVLTEGEDRLGYLLLQIIRSYLEINIYLSLEVHTEETLAAGEAELLRFSDLLKDFEQITAGSLQPAESFASIENRHANDHQFKNFRTRLSAYLNAVLPHFGVALPGGKPIRFSPEDTILESRYIKVNYESVVDWKQKCDYLRCSPSFHNRERHDHVILDAGEDSFVFAKLLFTFLCEVGRQTYPVALIHPLDAPVGTRKRKDKHLSLCRVRSHPSQPSEFVLMRSFVRGALVVEDVSTSNHFFVVDVVDGDSFLRMKKIFGPYLDPLSCTKPVWYRADRI